MMSEKQKNLITRSIFGALFVAIMVLGFTRPHYMVVLFAVITGMTLWEFSGLVNDQKGISVNRFISTAAGVYFFVAVAGQRMGFVEGFSAYIPYILSIIYLFIAELYLKNENPLHCWAYTMLGQMYIALPFSMVNVLAFQTTPEGMLTVDMLLPLSVFVLLWKAQALSTRQPRQILGGKHWWRRARAGCLLPDRVVCQSRSRTPCPQ